jgi:hypothetical protein
MNIGGPAHHVSMLSGRLDPGRFQTRLAYGKIAASEVRRFIRLATSGRCSG